ncbi:glutathione S-transferase [Salipiger pallidus]|uniref:Glutathione S-transferase n=1 Tax=Salipiger pallidus TaxID=1775170 RepID=A0A8J3EFS2_9RHOB|nr:glutathione S-transferase family protein [Salipiger pallidus]GGG61927.1 glutathione S-transferase [Salipiger pallidus]
MIVLHHVPESRSMRVLWLLHELGVEFEVVPHAMDRSLRDAAYLSLSPAGRVPALEMDGGVMFESLAMMEYLCERFAEAWLGRASGHPDRRAFLSWLHFAETLSQHCANLTQQHIMLRDDSMRSPIIMQLEAKRIGKCYDALEARLGGCEYMLGSAFSAVDVAIGQAVYMARHFAVLDGHPQLADWYERITQREAFNASLPGAGPRLYAQEFYPAWEVPS